AYTSGASQRRLPPRSLSADSTRAGSVLRTAAVASRSACQRERRRCAADCPGTTSSGGSSISRLPGGVVVVPSPFGPDGSEDGTDHRDGDHDQDVGEEAEDDAEVAEGLRGVV